MSSFRGNASTRTGGGYTSSSGSSGNGSSSRYNGTGSNNSSGGRNGITNMVRGNAARPGASASVPVAARDVTSGGIGAEYGPYSHIRSANATGTRAVPHAGSYGNRHMGSSASSGSRFGQTSAGSTGSSNHSSADLLNNDHTGKQFKAAAGVAGATAGPFYGYNDRRGSEMSTASTSISTKTGAKYFTPGEAYAPAGLLWDKNEKDADDYLVSEVPSPSTASRVLIQHVLHSIYPTRSETSNAIGIAQCGRRVAAST